MGPVLTYELLNKLRLPSFGLLLQMNTYKKISVYASENKSTEIVAYANQFYIVINMCQITGVRS